MSLDEFETSVTADQPPSGMDAALTALWWDAKGDWETAHHTAQSVETPETSWVHAYLHRKEGNADNASYWYTKCGRKPSQDDLESEWQEIASALLAV